MFPGGRHSWLLGCAWCWLWACGGESPEAFDGSTDHSIDTQSQPTLPTADPSARRIDVNWDVGFSPMSRGAFWYSSAPVTVQIDDALSIIDVASVDVTRTVGTTAQSHSATPSFLVPIRLTPRTTSGAPPARYETLSSNTVVQDHVGNAVHSRRQISRIRTALDDNTSLTYYAEFGRLRFTVDVRSSYNERAFGYDFPRGTRAYIGANGELRLSNTHGELTISKPNAFSGGAPVSAQWRIDGSTAWIVTAARTGRPVHIDPSIVWSGHLSGTNNPSIPEGSFHRVRESANHICAVGSNRNVPSPEVNALTVSTTTKGVIVCIDRTTYSPVLISRYPWRLHDFDFMPDGDLVIVGSIADVSAGGAFNGGAFGSVRRIDMSAAPYAHVWTASIAAAETAINAIDIDGSGNIALHGETCDPALATTPGAFRATGTVRAGCTIWDGDDETSPSGPFANLGDGFVAVLTSTGALTAMSYAGPTENLANLNQSDGRNGVRALGVAWAMNGDVVMIGRDIFWSTTYVPTHPDPPQMTFPANQNGYIYRFSGALNQLASRIVQSKFTDVHVRSDDRIVVTGGRGGLSTTADAFITNGVGGSGAQLGIYSADLSSISYATQLDRCSATNFSHGLTEPETNRYLTVVAVGDSLGSSSTTMPVTPVSWDSATGDTDDLQITLIDQPSATACVANLGDGSSETAQDIIWLSPWGRVAVVGGSRSGNYPVVSDPTSWTSNTQGFWTPTFSIVQAFDSDSCFRAVPGMCAVSTTCGDGTLDSGEQCDDGDRDDGDGCDWTCAIECSTSAVCNTGCATGACNGRFCDSYTIRSNGATCRAASGTCDAAETCDGVARTCPADGVQPMGTECRAASGVCDVAETCNGSSKTCPSDGVRSAGFQCRASAGICDPAEVCNGSAKTCPSDTLSNASTQCRASAGTCDTAENCTGASPSCPTDAKRPLGFECRATAGACDVPETCDGSSNNCPSDDFASNATQCRAASGVCDIAELCTGSSVSCPSDMFASSGVACASGYCDGANMCRECTLDAHCADGNPCTTNTCVANGCQATNVPGGTDCGGGLTCNGSGVCSGCSMGSQCSDGNECTSDVCTLGACSNPSVAAGTTCATGVCRSSPIPALCVACLNNSHCGGVTPFCDTSSNACVACLSDANCDDSLTCNVDQCVGGVCQHPLRATGTVCRAAAGICDLAESCDGVSASCPANGLSTNGTTCRAAVGVCDVTETCDGIQVTCPMDAKRASSFVCRSAAGICDEDELCDGTTNACPADMLSAATEICRATTGECDSAENCSGSSVDCANDTFDPAGISCSGGVCTGTNLCVECIASPDCDDGRSCTTDTCSSNVCQHAPLPAGTDCGMGLSCDGAGLCTGCTMDTQCADGNECTADVCTLGTCTNPALPSGANCASGVCEVDGVPSCVGCVADAQCPAPMPRCDTATYQCVGCLQSVDCNDNNACTNDLCDQTMCSTVPMNPGTSCPGGACSTEGTCVQCVDDSDCASPTPVCDTQTSQCVDRCATVTCAPGTLCNLDSGLCVGCISDDDCLAPTPTCNPSTGVCVGCGNGVECPPTELCDPERGRCGLDPMGDADQDGILNGVECADLLHCQDTDEDTTPDYLDPDDDGDSVATRNECAACDSRSPGCEQECTNTDGDNLPNYLDRDDDGDTILTIDEVIDANSRSGPDEDLDGMVNWLDTDSDGDGSSDRIEGRNLSPNQIPNYLDANFLGGGGVSGGALRCQLTGSQRNPALWTLLFVMAVSLAERRRHSRNTVR